jgi:hypothetical protein
MALEFVPRWVCLACRSAIGHSRSQTRKLQINDRMQRRYRGQIANPGAQAKPLEGFYAGTDLV